MTTVGIPCECTAHEDAVLQPPRRGDSTSMRYGPFFPSPVHDRCRNAVIASPPLDWAPFRWPRTGVRRCTCFQRNPDGMNDSSTLPLPAPPLPRAGQSRAWWQAPASPSALAWAIAQAAAAHDGPVLAVAKDNHAAHQLEADLRTLLGHDATLPILPFPDWETLPYDRFS